MPNRLANATSPYLLQHKDNPVDWYPWGDEAIAKSKQEDKPIFLSIGYSACHWCHVMEHESFENEAIAATMNENFICIKVDREERPDLDQIYMQAVQLMTGSGGWPMSVFLTPELRPFYGGTYWPPTAKFGRPGFDQVLVAVADAYKNKREQVDAQSQEMIKHLESSFQVDDATAELNTKLLDKADRWLKANFDEVHGGFGSAPKFPHSMDLSLILQMWSRDPQPERLRIVTHTLDKMAAGGIYDHLGGGFARYSVDDRWLVPHFEKMLYDNALLTSIYANAYKATKNSDYRRVAGEIIDYLLRDMTDPAGGFYSTEDADSEGVEGKFYVWSLEEVKSTLGDRRGEQFAYVYDVTASGNFEEKNILNLPRPISQAAKLKDWDIATLEQELSEDRIKLLEVRSKRVRPGLDDKVLVSWNALMIEGICHADQAFGHSPGLAAAQKCADFILTKMRRDDGGLWHTWRQGVATLNAYLDDYSYFISSLITLYETDANPRWLTAASELADRLLAKFADPAGGFFFTADDHEKLIIRSKDLADSSVPSGNAMAAWGLLRLSKLTGKVEYETAAVNTLKIASSLMARAPQAAGQALATLDFWLGPSYEMVLVGGSDPETVEIANAIKAIYQPRRVIAVSMMSSDSSHENSPALPLFEGRAAANGKATFYLCSGQTCQAPVTGRGAILSAAQKP